VGGLCLTEKAQRASAATCCTTQGPKPKTPKFKTKIQNGRTPYQNGNDFGLRWVWLWFGYYPPKKHFSIGFTYPQKHFSSVFSSCEILHCLERFYLERRSAVIMVWQLAQRISHLRISVLITESELPL
jgi:hypothetical protein